MALRYQQQTQPTANHRSIAGNHYQIHNCQNNINNNARFNNNNSLSLAPSCTSTPILQNHYPTPPPPNHYHYQFQAPRSSAQPFDQQQLQRLTAVRTQQQIQQQRTAARLAQPQPPIVATSVPPYRIRQAGTNPDINPWISSFAYSTKQVYSSLKPANQETSQLLMPSNSNCRSKQMATNSGAQNKPASTSGSNKIRSTIESLFHRGHHHNKEQPAPEMATTTASNNNNNNQGDTNAADNQTRNDGDTKPQRKNKWRSIPGIRRSLSNLFVQQKQKQPRPAPGVANPAGSSPIVVPKSSTKTPILDDETPSFVTRREHELEISRSNNNSNSTPSNTCPQPTGPLVRLRYEQAQTSARSTNTLSSSSGASSTAAVAMVSSRQSSNDGNSADSGYSPTEPEMSLVPHPANNALYRNKMQISTSMYLQRCSQHSGTSNNNINDLDVYERNIEKSLESLSSCDRGGPVHQDEEGDEADDEVVLGDWPPAHLRNRGAISSPNIPRLVRKNMANPQISSSGVQRFRPEQTVAADQQVPVEDEDDDDEMDDDFDGDFDTSGLSTNQAGSLCHLTMTSFNAQNDLITGTRQQLRRPRRTRAVSDHSLHRRSKDQRAQERELAAGGDGNLDSLHQQRQDHPTLLSSVAALSTTSNTSSCCNAPGSGMIKSATLGALASGHKNRCSASGFPKILSDVPRAEFTLTNSTTFFNKSESSLVDHRQTKSPQNDPQPATLTHPTPQQNQSRPLPIPPKHRPPLPPTPHGQRNSAALLLQSELQQQQQQQQQLNSSYTYGRPFTIPDPSSNLTFEITPIIPPQLSTNNNNNNNAAMSASGSSVSTGSGQPVMNKSPPMTLGSQTNCVTMAPLSRLSAATTNTGPTVPCSNASTSPNSSASSSIENAPAKKMALSSPPLILTSNPSTNRLLSTVPTNGNSNSTNCSTSTGGDSIDAGNAADLQQQEQVFRRFGCQRLLEMQRRIEENCRLSERQQNEQEAVTRLLTNIRRNIRTTEI